MRENETGFVFENVSHREKSKKGRNLKLFSKFFSTSDQRFLLDVTLASFFSKLLYEKK